ncbi:MAG: hypothetical protein GF364_08805 [Candidatus Lokiarchaeota archaeon]|nr:hypothetical protein [Candidatus Lokiarchaeota archaeon]
MKTKFFIVLIVFLVFVCCNQKKLDDARANEIIKNAFELSEEDSIEILGISEEPNGVSIVKFKLNGVQISSKMRKYDKGWQLDEIQNEFGMWIPADNLTKSFGEAEKQKSALKDIIIITTGLVDYITDTGMTPKQNGAIDKNSEFYEALVPFYLKELPIKDPWGNNYLVYCGLACKGNYGIPESFLSSDDFLVISYGSDGTRDSWKYDSTNPKNGLFSVNSENDFSNDLINWSGSWIRAPRSTTQ